jgi:hypothetical protein
MTYFIIVYNNKMSVSNEENLATIAKAGCDVNNSNILVQCINLLDYVGRNPIGSKRVSPIWEIDGHSKTMSYLKMVGIKADSHDTKGQLLVLMEYLNSNSSFQTYYLNSC